MFVVSTEEAQLARHQICGAGAGCGQSPGGWKLLFGPFALKKKSLFRLVLIQERVLVPVENISLTDLCLIRNDASLLPSLDCFFLSTILKSKMRLLYEKKLWNWQIF